MVNMNLYILNKHMECVGIMNPTLPKGLPYFDDVHNEKLEHGAMTLEFSVPANHPDSALLETEGYIVYPNMDNEGELFTIKNIEEDDTGGQYVKKVSCESTAMTELNGIVIRPATLNSYTLEQALAYVLTESDWDVNRVEYDGTKDFNFDSHITALAALHEIADKFDAEISFTVEMKGLNVIRKCVNIVQQRGEDTGIIFEYNRNIQGVKRIDSTYEKVTAIVPVGPADASGNPMTIATCNATPPAGFERGPDWIGSLDALQRWGLPGGKHYTVAVTFDDAENPDDLYSKGLDELKKRSKPQINYEVDLLTLERLTGYEAMKVRLGDRIRIVDKTLFPPVYLDARIIEMERSKTDPTKDKVVIGEFIPLKPNPRKLIHKTIEKVRFNWGRWSEGGKVKILVDSWKHPSDETRINGVKIFTGSVTTDQIATQAITEEKVAPEAITAGKIAVGSITSNHISAEGIVADVIKGGTLQLGGLNNQNGKFNLVNAEGDISVDFDAETETFFIDQLSVNKIYSPSVASYGFLDKAIYVDAGTGDDNRAVSTVSTPYKSLARAFQDIPLYNDGHITIYLKSNVNENIDISRAGKGVIEFRPYPDGSRFTIYGNVFITGCTNRINILNLNIKAAVASRGVVEIAGSPNVFLNGCRIFGSGISNYGAYAFDGGALYIYSSSVQDVTNEALRAAYNGSMMIYDVTGLGGTYGAVAQYNGRIGIKGTIPAGNSGAYNAIDGGTVVNYSSTDNTTYADPGSFTITATWDAIMADSYRESPANAWLNSGDVRQGQYNPSISGLNKGLWLFPDTITSVVSGKTINKIRIFITRKSSNGYNYPTAPVIHYHGYTSKPTGNPSVSGSSFNGPAMFRGQSAWIELPSSWYSAFQNGSAKGIALYTTSTNTFDYAVWDAAAKIEITYH